MHQTYNGINLQYAVNQSLPIWGDLEGWNAKEFDEENGMYYYSARYYAPPTFISRDPMFEKYPSISPYTYCANNPVMFVDPTGEEKLNGMDKQGTTQKSDVTSYNNFEQAEDIDNNIKINAHGCITGFTYYDNNKKEEVGVHTVDEFKKFLNDYSSEWKNRKEGEPIVITLYGCHNGGDDDYQNMASFAELCSQDKDFKDVIFIAADQFVFSSKDGTYTTHDGTYKGDKEGWKETGKEGNWKAFKNGKNIINLPGNFDPDFITKMILDYDKKIE